MSLTQQSRKRIIKKNVTRGDPVMDHGRIHPMLTTTQPGEDVGATVPPIRYASGKSGKKPGIPRKAGMDGAAQGQDWVAVMRAIREEQDTAAFTALFRHFAPRVKAYLMKSGASEALAEECTQEAMATVWRKVHLFDPSRASVSTWIFTIARNRRIDHVRRMRRPEPEDLPWGPEAEPDQADVVSLQQETEKLAHALGQLPEKQRRLVEKAYFGDLTHSEIAAETGLPLGTIKSRLRLALERLRHAMG